MAPESSTPPLSILVVDDERIVRDSMTDWFRQDGHCVDAASDARQALALAARKPYAVAFLDIRMPDTDGLELQARLLRDQPNLTIVIMTAFASVETAVEALKGGAYDYITKPFDPDELSHLVGRIAEHRRLRSENLRLRERLTSLSAPPPIIGDSPPMRQVLDLVQRIAATDSTVLIQGESGTGKELVGRAIHAGSRRRDGPVVVVNCGALAEGVLESELFGHEKGAFTGAEQLHRGKFELADGGTIFLDEIGCLSPKVQVELLRVLEEKVVTRVGGSQAIPVDFRVVAATNQNLDDLVAAGRFREDLFWRLNVFVIQVPPLRERGDDIDLLADHFLDHFAHVMNRGTHTFSAAARQALRRHGWPGNVRELQNAIERAVVLGTPPRIEAGDLPLPAERSSEESIAPLAEVEKRHIARVLAQCSWNIQRAAKALGVNRGTLYNKMRRFGLERTEHQAD